MMDWMLVEAGDAGQLRLLMAQHRALAKAAEQSWEPLGAPFAVVIPQSPSDRDPSICDVTWYQALVRTR